MSYERELLDSIINYKKLARTDATAKSEQSGSMADAAAVKAVGLLAGLIDSRIEAAKTTIVSESTTSARDDLNSRLRGL